MILRHAAWLLALTVSACTGTPPAHGCGGSEPLGCSIPTAVLVVSSDYEEQADKFHGACVTHDLCYRHGAATYGLSREECDAEFYENIKSACSGFKGLGVLDPQDFAKCQFAARQTYDAVRAHGERHYRSASSTYCVYR